MGQNGGVKFCLKCDIIKIRTFPTFAVGLFVSKGNYARNL